MPDYRDIYNQVISSNERYNIAQNSPGFRAIVGASDKIGMLSGRSLDVGCGVGFVLEYLAGPLFDFNIFGVDISDEAIRRAKSRMQHVTGAEQRLLVLENQTLPFEDDFFSLITCFDVLEHLDEADISATLKEIERVLLPGGIFFGSVSCRTSNQLDQNGENLHRTVRSVDWWIDQTKPRTAEFDSVRSQLVIWKRKPRAARKQSSAEH
jgi:ubiquinone/menaquinone biosynthesis C-methylase UbiE